MCDVHLNDQKNLNFQELYLLVLNKYVLIYLLNII